MRWEVSVRGDDPARPSPPKPAAWAPLLSRKDGRGALRLRRRPEGRIGPCRPARSGAEAGARVLAEESKRGGDPESWTTL
jgi:hypothetical protein